MYEQGGALASTGAGIAVGGVYLGLGPMAIVAAAAIIAGLVAFRAGQKSRNRSSFPSVGKP